MTERMLLANARILACSGARLSVAGRPAPAPGRSP
jgi:hypothetical protein